MHHGQGQRALGQSRCGCEYENGTHHRATKDTERSVTADLENNRDEHARKFVELRLVGPIDAKISHRLLPFKVDSEKSKSYEKCLFSYKASCMFSC